MRKLLPGSPRCYAVALALALVACTDAPTALRPELEPQFAKKTFGATLLECPVSVETVDTVTIGPAGGILELDGHRLEIPAGAVLSAGSFAVRVPASNYLQVDFTRVGETSFLFKKPVSLTISYDRCNRKNLKKTDLRVYYIDPETRVILQDLGGTDDKAARTVAVTTDHLSSYALGTPD